jgi:hypothetical protein
MLKKKVSFEGTLSELLTVCTVEEKELGLHTCKLGFAWKAAVCLLALLSSAIIYLFDSTRDLFFH